MAVNTIEPGHIYDHRNHGEVVVDSITQQVERWSTDGDKNQTLVPVVYYYPKNDDDTRKIPEEPLQIEKIIQFARSVEPTGETIADNCSDPRDSELRL